MVCQFTCFETHTTNQHFSNYNLKIIKHQCHIEIEMVKNVVFFIGSLQIIFFLALTGMDLEGANMGSSPLPCTIHILKIVLLDEKSRRIDQKPRQMEQGNQNTEGQIQAKFIRRIFLD